MRCTKAKGKCLQGHLKEQPVLDEVEVLLSKFQMTEVEVKDIIADLKIKHDDQQQYYTQRIEKVRSENESIRKKKELLYHDRLDGRITVNQYDKYLEELAEREEELNAEFSQLTSNDTSFMVTASYLLEIAKEAPRLFRSSKPALQRKLLKFVLSNLTIKGNKIDFNLKTPFDTIAECSKTSNWLLFQGTNSNYSQ